MIISLAEGEGPWNPDDVPNPDWSWPIHDDLDYIMTNEEIHHKVNETLKKVGATPLADIGSKVWYWTRNEVKGDEEDLAWGINMLNGWILSVNKRGSLKIRYISYID